MKRRLAGATPIGVRSNAGLGCRIQRTLLRRSAIRVCQPGPVAFHSSMTSAGRRIEINLRGLAERGRPAFFTTAFARASFESSGRFWYSCGRIACASMRVRSDFKVRREAGFLTILTLSHVEDVADIASLRVPDDH